MERAVVTTDLKSHKGRKHRRSKVWGYFRARCAFILEAVNSLFRRVKQRVKTCGEGLDSAHQHRFIKWGGKNISKLLRFAEEASRHYPTSQ